MVNLVHASFDVIAVAVALGLSFYCLRLLNKFFSGGIFESSFTAFLAAGFLFAAGIVFDIIAEAFEFRLLDLHIFHVGLDIVAFVVILYGVRRLYLAWTKLGSR